MPTRKQTQNIDLEFRPSTRINSEGKIISDNPPLFSKIPTSTLAYVDTTTPQKEDESVITSITPEDLDVGGSYIKESFIANVVPKDSFTKTNTKTKVTTIADRYQTTPRTVSIPRVTPSGTSGEVPKGWLVAPTVAPVKIPKPTSKTPGID